MTVMPGVAATRRGEASRMPRVAGYLTRDVSGRFAILVILASAIMASSAPLLAPHSYVTLFDNFQPPGTAGHLLGTDSFGRDIVSYLIWGTRVSFVFGFAAAAISLIIGTLVGAIPAYLGGWLDDAFARFTEILLVVPTFFLIIIAVALFGHNLSVTVLVVGLTIWPSNARIVRAQVNTLKSRGYVQAAHVSGASNLRVIFLHILPNGLSPVVVNSTLQVGFAILYEASLSFIGLGDPDQPSWGQLLFIARDTFSTAWWIAVFPGLAIVTLVLAINVLGDLMNRAVRHDDGAAIGWAR